MIYFTVRIVAERAGFDPDATWRVLGGFWVNNGMQSPKKSEKTGKKDPDALRQGNNRKTINYVLIFLS